MTSQEYIDIEVRRERQQRAQEAGQRAQDQAQSHSAQNMFNIQYGGQMGPSEVVLLRAKVNEMADKLAAERERCARIAEAALITDAAVRSLSDAGYNRACADIAAAIRNGE